MLAKHCNRAAKSLYQVRKWKNYTVSNTRTLCSTTISDKQAERLRNRTPDLSKFDQKTGNPEYEKRVYYGDRKDWVPSLKDVKDLSETQVFIGPPRLGWHDLPKRCGVLAMKVGMINGWDIYGVRKG